MLSSQPRSTDDRHRRSADAVGPFEYRFTSRSAASVRVARQVLTCWLGALPGVQDGDGLDEVLVVASELLTNAADHASGREGGLAIRGAVTGRSVVLEVEDDGEGFTDPSVIDLRSADAAAEHGRGLFIVQTLVDDFTVERPRGVTVVRCRKDGMLRESSGAATG
jgi:anti-sigma regulatory factor (Ser/Thr protein kinase)